MKHLRIRLLTAVLALFCLTGTALAYDRIPDLDQLCSLTVESAHGGVTYDVYRVCTVDEWARFTPVGDFAEIADRIELLIAGGAWKAMPETLIAWLTSEEADGHMVEPDATKTTDPETRQAVFTDLPTGLYLIRGREYLTETGRYYIPVSSMICLPDWEKAEVSASDDAYEWVYDVGVISKGSEREDDLTTRSALKRWRGSGGTARPAEVTVRLIGRNLQTGLIDVVEEVTLSDRNNWSVMWTELDNVNYTWTVEEVEVPVDYVSIKDETGVNVVITNYFDPDGPKNDPDPDPKDPEDPQDPNDPGNPPPETPNIPSEDIDDDPPPLTWPPFEEETVDPTPEDEEDILDEDPPLARLPQTGVLWWPVPFLAMGGMFLFILGWVLNRRGQNDEE